MSVEQQPTHVESGEQQRELEALAAEKRAEREHTPENVSEHAEKQASDAETARKIIDQQDAKPEPVAAPEAAQPKPTFTARLNQALSYTETMASVQQKLSPVSRSFSKVIHTPVVEKTSEALESTVMRPSVALGAASTALLVGAIFSYFARRYGYAIRGSELIVSLVIGGIIGLGIEWLAHTLKRRKH